MHELIFLKKRKIIKGHTQKLSQDLVQDIGLRLRKNKHLKNCKEGDSVVRILTSSLEHSVLIQHVGPPTARGDNRFNGTKIVTSFYGVRKYLTLLSFF